MALSKNSVKLLQWLNHNDDWKYIGEIEKQCKYFDHRSFSALKSSKFLDECVFEDEVPEYDDFGRQYMPLHYRISDTGKAYLEGRVTRWLPEVREWIAIGISVTALIISIIALITGQSQQPTLPG